MKHLVRLLNARDELIAHLRGIKGIITVGVEKKGNRPSLVVFVDSTLTTPSALPSEYDHIPVKIVHSDPANAHASPGD